MNKHRAAPKSSPSELSRGRNHSSLRQQGLPLGPEGEGKRKYSLYVAFVFLITRACSGKFGEFHKNIKKKMDSLEYWHPEETTVNSAVWFYISSVFSFHLPRVEMICCYFNKMSHNDTEPHSVQYFLKYFWVFLVGHPKGCHKPISTAVTMWDLWRPMKGASAGHGPLWGP